MSQLRDAMAAVKASPKNPAAWIALGDLLASEGQSDKATQSYQRALQLDPTNQAAQRGLAQLIIQNAGSASPAAPSTPVRPTPPEQNRPATPSRPVPEPRRATPPSEVRRPQSPPATSQRRSAEERVSRPTPRREESIAAPRTEPSATSSSVGKMASTFEMRERPARPQKPSEGRLRAGLLFIVFIPVLCICALALAVSQVFQLLGG